MESNAALLSITCKEMRLTITAADHTSADLEAISCRPLASYRVRGKEIEALSMLGQAFPMPNETEPYSFRSPGVFLEGASYCIALSSESNSDFSIKSDHASLITDHENNSAQAILSIPIGLPSLTLVIQQNRVACLAIRFEIVPMLEDNREDQRALWRSMADRASLQLLGFYHTCHAAYVKNLSSCSAKLFLEYLNTEYEGMDRAVKDFLACPHTVVPKEITIEGKDPLLAETLPKKHWLYPRLKRIFKKQEKNEPFTMRVVDVQLPANRFARYLLDQLILQLSDLVSYLSKGAGESLREALSRLEFFRNDLQRTLYSSYLYEVIPSEHAEPPLLSTLSDELRSCYSAFLSFRRTLCAFSEHARLSTEAIATLYEGVLYKRILRIFSKRMLLLDQPGNLFVKTPSAPIRFLDPSGLDVYEISSAPFQRAYHAQKSQSGFLRVTRYRGLMPFEHKIQRNHENLLSPLSLASEPILPEIADDPLILPFSEIPFLPASDAPTAEYLLSVVHPSNQEANAPVLIGERNVMVGTVRTDEQLAYNLASRCYYVPQRVISEEQASVSHVALYEEGLSSEGTIRYYGKVLSMDIVPRYEIPLPSARANLEEMYYLYHIEEWISLADPIRLKDTTRGKPRFTSLFLLTHCHESYQLFAVKSAEQYLLMQAMETILSLYEQYGYIEDTITYAVTENEYLVSGGKQLRLVNMSGEVLDDIPLESLLHAPLLTFTRICRYFNWEPEQE